MDADAAARRCQRGFAARRRGAPDPADLAPRVGRLADYAPLLARVLVRRFELPAVDSYAGLEKMALEAIDSGYESIR